MSVKIRISYTTDEELAGVIRLLSPVVKSYKVSRKKEGKYRNAYADLDIKNIRTSLHARKSVDKYIC